MSRPILLVLAVACTAKTVSPPLSSRGPTVAQGTFGTVALTSGEFQRPHRVIGVIQMTQSGYKWFHEVEIVDDANPESLLFKIGSYARQHGADGVQHLSLVDLDPQTPAERAGKQIDSAVRISRAVQHGHYTSIAGEGTETRYEVSGELIQFQGAP